MEKLKDLNEIKHKLIDAVKTELDSGIQNVDTAELGEVVDMIKDIASAEESCMEACYYEVVTEAMSDYDGKQGYDRWRYSSGRFAPKGRGHISGYLPPYMADSETLMAEPMGYDRTNGDMASRVGNANARMGNMRYGYTSKDMGIKDGMTSKEKMDKAIDVMGDIWADASADERRTLKVYVEDLLHQMEQG